jgi:hypothetical protein
MATKGSVLEALKKRLAAMKGGSQKFDPKAGKTYKIRFMPFKDQPAEDPIPTYAWYYLDASFLATEQFEEEDPVAELRKSLFAAGSDSDKAFAKKLFARQQSYFNIIDRDNENDGPLPWRLRADQAAVVLEFFVNEDYGDIMDPETGYDFQLTVTKAKSKFGDKDILEYTFLPKKNPTPLSTNPSKMKEWMDAVPTAYSVVEYGRKSVKEVEALTAKWLESEIKKAETASTDKNAKTDEAKATAKASAKSTGTSRDPDEEEESQDEEEEDKTETKATAAEPTKSGNSVNDVFSKYTKK